jgi:outer membrane protein assembly factor BamB
MKTINTILIVSTFLLCLTASTCKKEPPPEPVPYINPFAPKPIQLTLLWHTHLADNKQEAYSINPILNSNGDILMSSLFNPDGREIFKLYDGKTGVLKWKWDDYNRNEEYFMDERHILINDILVLSKYNATYAFNVVTGQTVWKSYIDTMYGSHMVFSDGEYVYKDFHGEKGSYSSYVFRTKYDQLNWELVCTYIDTTRRFDRIDATSISFFTNNKGEKMMIYPIVDVNGDSHLATICCYNLSTKSFEWIKDYSDKYLEFKMVKSITSYQNAFLYVAASGAWKLVAINVVDGSVAWENKTPDFGVNLFLYKDNLISICNGNSPVQCFNQQTGNLVWQRTFAKETSPLALNFTFGDANILKNYLFSTQCHNLLILNLDNGNVVFNKQAAVDGGCLQYGIAINEKERKFYVQDRKYVNCFKLPDEVKY